MAGLAGDADEGLLDRAQVAVTGWRSVSQEPRIIAPLSSPMIAASIFPSAKIRPT
jgi:hypothetical protein